MKIVEQVPARALKPQTQKDVARIGEIWSECLRASKGPFLFGARPGIADAMYAPVVSRFHTYSIPDPTGYVQAIWSWPILQDWVAAARAETLRAKFHEP